MNWNKVLFGEGYMSSWHCLGYDSIVGWLTIFLCLSILSGYLVISWYWYKNLKNLPKSDAKRSLFNMMNIFLFCGICGYLFTIVMMWYPIWWIRVLFLAVLSFFTWCYALSPKLNEIYKQLADKSIITSELNQHKAISKKVETKTKEMHQPIDNLSHSVYFGINETTNPKIVEQINHIRQEIDKLEKIYAELVSIKGDRA